MAGHSKFKNIMHRKGSQDKKRAKLFSRLTREISVSAKLGIPDPNVNPRLRTAINNAFAANMPKDNIDKAIRKHSENEKNSLIEEIVYEGYGPSGIAVIIECITDNKNRTASEIRSTFSKNNGNLGISGSVRHFFEKVGIAVYSKNICEFEDIFEFSISVGVIDIQETEEHYELTIPNEEFHAILEKLEVKYELPVSSSVEWKAKELLQLEKEKIVKVIELLEKLEDIDDVQNLYSNLKIPNDIL
ncbi:MAG: YebC/PmpR family DNA-binding transcriptional regulator [Rickettsiales bacterium]|nr:YebC/PmpR family DNA-binding transcriptional regulator [Rickettsiales bacterium]OUV52992.1 MAG: hypothetical protein CBC87_06485 [Rickettsiales bacterium TMED127]|tara:strand:- start:90499 stop:91233 length:735 start_codon:yes stop_codon:yes gene_type:complete